MATAGPYIMYLDGTRSGYVSLKVSQDLERVSDETLRALGIGALVWDGGGPETRKVIRVTAARPHAVNLTKDPVATHDAARARVCQEALDGMRHIELRGYAFRQHRGYRPTGMMSNWAGNTMAPLVSA